MRRWILVACSFVTLAVGPTSALANTWPKLSGEIRAEPCGEALQVAQAAFQSNAFLLYAPPVIPAGLRSTLVLEPDGVDISGGDALKSDPAAFDKLPKDGESSSGSIFWKKITNHGARLVLEVTPHGWQGDMYSAFIVKENVTSRQFLALDRSGPKSPQLDPIILDGWRPPLVFQNKLTGAVWLIDVGHPAKFLGEWQIHVVDPTGAQVRCRVQFRPDTRNAASLLPPAVRDLADLLDSTLGSGAGEGTLQPTARLRIAAQHTWANAALRPWVAFDAHNTRAEVDASLKAWSRRNAKRHKVYQNIQRQYPLAEQSLAEYYQRSFGRSVEDAKASAAYVLDIAFRSHFTIHSDDPNRNSRNDQAQSNPWRNTQR